MSSQSPRARRTRDALLDAAWKLIERHGDASVSLDEIARAAKVSRQAFYLHFSGRSELLTALIAYIQKRLGVRERLERVEGAPTGIAMLDELVKFSAEYSPEILPFARALDAARRTDPAAEAAWSSRMQSRLARARTIAARLDAEGALAPGVTVSEAADLIWTLTSLGTYDDLVVYRRWSKRRYVERLRAALHAALLRAPDSRPRYPKRG